MKRHALPALAALVVVAGGPQVERFDAIHAPRVVLLLVLAAAVLWRRRSALGRLEALALAALAAMGVSAALSTSPAYALFPLFEAAAACALLLGTAWRDDGERRLWLGWLAGAVVVCAALGFVEALGLGPASLHGRAPSGTHGQRNALAHVLLLGCPLVWSAALESPRRAAAWWAGAALVAAVIVLTRSRAAWVVAVPVALSFIALQRRRAVLGPLVAAVLGGAVALVLPVALAWRSARPYSDTLSRLVDWSSGSGAGRLVEWRASLELFASSPLLGVGPGNWFVLYGVRHGGSHYAHSDAVGLLVERGVVGLGLLVALAVASLWLWRGRDLALVAPVLLAACGLGLLDSVVQLPAPVSMLSAVLFCGVRSGAPSPLVGERAVVRGPWFLFVALALPASLATASRFLSSAERAPFEQLELAAKLDPLDGELRFTLARGHASAGDCARAGPHLDALSRLLPAHPQLPALEAACPPATRGPPAAGEAR